MVIGIDSPPAGVEAAPGSKGCVVSGSIGILLQSRLGQGSSSSPSSVPGMRGVFSVVGS